MPGAPLTRPARPLPSDPEPRPAQPTLDGDPHPPAAPARTVRWSGLWSPHDALLTLGLLGLLFGLQATLLLSTRLVAIWPPLGLLLAFFPTFATAGAVALKARHRGLSLRQLGFVRPRTWRPIVLAWLVAVFAGPATAWSGSLLASAGWRLPVDRAATSARAPLEYAALAAIAVAVLIPLVEEFVFRGLIHRSVRTHWSLVPAAALSGLIFAAVHLDLPHLLPLFIVGFVLAWSYERSGSLWGSIVPHAGLNALTLLTLATRS